MNVVDLPTVPEFGSEPQYPIESVDNALRALFLVSEHPRVRLTDVSNYLGVASSTAYRLLAMLQFRGYVRQEPSSRLYVLGPTLDSVAFSMLRRMDVRILARPTLEQLNRDLEETVHFGRLEGADVRFIDSIESSRALRVASRLGKSMPAHCTSTGKALLAGLTDDEVIALYPQEELVQLTARSLGTRTQLIAELDVVRARGWASSSEESEEGVSSMAVALNTPRAPRLAVNASVPASRMGPKRQETISVELRVAADRIDEALI